jgi:drug/metabolite transporter (DMT)-like permease
MRPEKGDHEERKTTMKDADGKLPILGLLAAMFLWGSSFIALKLAFRTYHPMVVIFGRMAVATLCFAFLAGRFRKQRYQSGDWFGLLLLCLFEPCLYFVFEAWALTNTTAGQAGMITALMPLLVAISARVILNEPLSRRTLTGFLLAVGGAVWLSASARAEAHAPNPVLGNFLEFLAMISGAGYTIMARRLTPRYSPLFLTALQSGVGAVFFFPLMFIPRNHLPQAFEPNGFLAILYLGVFVTLGAYGLFNYGVSRLPAGQAASFVNLIPVITVILGWLLLGETFTAGQIAGSVLVFAGVYVSQQAWRSQRLAERAAKRLEAAGRLEE